MTPMWEARSHRHLLLCTLLCLLSGELISTPDILLNKQRSQFKAGTELEILNCAIQTRRPGRQSCLQTAPFTFLLPHAMSHGTSARRSWCMAESLNTEYLSVREGRLYATVCASSLVAVNACLVGALFLLAPACKRCFVQLAVSFCRQLQCLMP